METQELHRGRLIDHRTRGGRPGSQSEVLSRAAGGAGCTLGGEGPGFFWADELCVSSADSPAAQGRLTGRTHFALQANSREAVDAAYKVGLSAGGVDNGKPGERPYHPGYYAAFLLDPDQNNVEVVFHGPHKRSAASVKINF